MQYANSEGPSMQSDLDVLCSSTFTTVSTDFASGQRRPRSACIDRKLHKDTFPALCIILVFNAWID